MIKKRKTKMKMINYGDIIVIGGGGFGRNPNAPIIEKYIIDQSNAIKPNITFFPTASAENENYIENYYKAFSQLNCNAKHISLFSRTPDVKKIIEESDIIYIGGGNTKSMLAVFEEWGVNQLLIKANQNGTILAGVSAGMICWYEKGVTDSWSDELRIIDCLNIIPGCACPHYDGEEDRRPSVYKFIENNDIESCLAIEDGAAAHYKNNILYKTLCFYENKNVYTVSKKENKIIELKHRIYSIA